MEETVSFARHGAVAVLTIDNPPVNALSYSVRTGILRYLAEIEADPGIRAIVLFCAGKTFSAGADVREFGQPPMEPIMPMVMNEIEKVGKLTVVAIQGQALGGGFETTLCFDYRVATPTARLGLPEIKLGLFPGGGGTQRLPRLIGLPRSIEMIISGNPVDANTAKSWGIIDEIIDGDLREGALAYAEGLIRSGAARRRLCDRTVDIPAGFSFADAQAKAVSDAKGLVAARMALDALRAATDRPFMDGLAEERRLFHSIRNHPETTALRHLFSAEREVGKIPGLPAGTQPRPITRVAVFGAGTMGTGVAISLLQAGYAVVAIDTTQAALDRSLATIRSTIAGQVDKGRIMAAERDTQLARFTQSLAIDAAGDCELVIECVFEDMAIKQDLFARLAGATQPHAVLATNTSALDVNAIAAASGRPADVIGMHFFSPANIMKLVEVVNADCTSPDVLATAMQVCKRMGKLGVVSGVCDGFIGNRMLRGYRREAELLVLEGATPQQVDDTLTRFGMAMGLHAMGDMAGLDVAAKSRHRLRAEGKLTDPRVGAVQDTLVERGRYGLKSGKGMYRYDEGSRKPLPDPEVDAIIAETAQRLGIVRRDISAEEILYRCLIPLVNEGARILEEGIAFGAGDIDVIYCNGYGFPRRHGGPMRWADTQGLATIVARIEQYAKLSGPEHWQCAPLLRELAAAGRTFSDYPRAARAR